MTKRINPIFMMLLAMNLLCGTITMVSGIFIFIDEFFIESQPGGISVSLLMMTVGGILLMNFYYQKKKLDVLIGVKKK